MIASPSAAIYLDKKMNTLLSDGSTLTIRQANLDDLHEIWRLWGAWALFDEYRQHFNQATDLEAGHQFLIERLKSGDSVLFTACEGTKTVGFAQLYWNISSLRMQKTLLLNDLYVTKESRHRGVGRALIKATEDFAAQQHVVYMEMESAASEKDALSLYKNAGWQPSRDYVVYERKLLAA
ncbi:GNAT family N-acetyltransferase [Iodobacter fluviatilis]|uniref:GNAT family N-acetyltransferase n=2 Tax=Iodobacter fluviatilis TaxID=537 RepID=A0A7G3G4V9_9NEIS|nr:GNAT family N-acetyltransferase [Iodobacter fluviatilis]